MATGKRKSSPDDHGQPEKKSKEGEEDMDGMVLLKGLAFYLHPAALGKTRKSIFERQIVCKGGRLVTDIQSSEMGANKELVVLVEDSLTDSSKLVSIASKLRASPGIPSGIAVVGLSWLSKCLEKDQLVSRHPFEIAPSVARADQGRSSAAEKVSAPNTAPLVSEPVVSPAPSTSNEDSRQIFIERNKHKFVCAQSSETPRVAIDHPNKAVTDQLERLAAVYKASNDTWRAFSYQKAASAIKNYGQKITSRDEAVAIRGVGQKMADKVMEIIEEGTLQKADELCDSEKARTLDLFNRVWGAGPTTAERWYEQGLRTLDDLRQRGHLTRQQVVGVRLFEDLDQRMPREECTEILAEVRRAADAVGSELEVIGCGSYRRGKATCGDLDVLVTHEDEAALEGVFEAILNHLRESKFLTDDLSIQRDGRQRKYLGVCRLPGVDRLHRRLDIIVVPPDERSAALLYFTGSAHFNRSMRLLAGKMGMSLSEHALTANVLRHKREKINEGAALPTPTEKSIFEALGLAYRPPEERNH